MKFSVVKLRGGILQPASEVDCSDTDKLKTGEIYEVEIKQPRNAKFHRKVFAFLNFCYEHWDDVESKDERGQFEVFRSHLTVLAGYYDTYHGISGNVRIEAKSISYGSMTQREFESFYIALTNAAMKHIFKTTDKETYKRLISFF